MTVTVEPLYNILLSPGAVQLKANNHSDLSNNLIS